MLKAIVQRKLRRDRQPTEDMMTASVFGPLEYMSPLDAGEAVKRVLLPQGVDWVEATSLRSLMLWKRLKLGNKRLVEPDVLLVLDRPPLRSLTICIEVKWGALQGEDQIRRQQQAIQLAHASVEDTMLVYLDVTHVKAHRAVAQAIGTAQTSHRTEADSWHHIAMRARVVATERAVSPALRAWARDLYLALAATYRPFTGFASVYRTPLDVKADWTLPPFPKTKAVRNGAQKKPAT